MLELRIRGRIVLCFDAGKGNKILSLQCEEKSPYLPALFATL
ncbi:hypothetical protein [Acinetobacter thermotolerans]